MRNETENAHLTISNSCVFVSLYIFITSLLSEVTFFNFLHIPLL